VLLVHRISAAVSGKMVSTAAHNKLISCLDPQFSI